MRQNRKKTRHPFHLREKYVFIIEMFFFYLIELCLQFEALIAYRESPFETDTLMCQIRDWPPSERKKRWMCEGLDVFYL